MLPLEVLVKCGVYGLMALGVIAAVGAVALRNLFHAGLALALVLVVVAGIFVTAGAEFLGMVQILLYVGGVMTLIIYTIMLTGRLGASDRGVSIFKWIVPVVAGSCFVAALGRLFLDATWPQKQGDGALPLSVAELGQSLMTDYVFPFEVLGVLLFAVLIGAIVVARQDRPS